MRYAFLMLFFAISTGCGVENGCDLMVNGRVRVFENPYPDGYPTSAPKKNHVIDILDDEGVELVGRRVEKDFMAYKVRLKDGREGFILYDQNISVIPNGCDENR